MNIDQAIIMACSESQCSSDIAYLLEVNSSSATPANVDDFVGTQSSVAVDDSCASSSTFPGTSDRPLRTKRKYKDLELSATKRPRSCAISLEMWKGRLPGVEDDLLDAVWSLRGGDPIYPKAHASNRETSLADGIPRELEHAVHAEQKYPALVEDACNSQPGSLAGNLERPVTVETDKQAGGIDKSMIQAHLSVTDEATEFGWQPSLTGTANDPSPLLARSCTAQPLTKSDHNIDILSPRTSDGARTSDRDFASPAVVPQLIRWGIIPIGTWGQIAGTTVGAVDVPLLCI